jgi:3-oxoacyl-(acyl-carrier-protein) synthase/acyl carrier protein
MRLYKDTDIAVIGMAGRFPGAANIDEYWDNIKNGIESIRFFTDRELRESGINPELYNNKNYVKAKGYLDDTNYFDSQFFRYTLREARLLNPQTRIFHEVVYSALEDAGYSKINSDNKIGLFAGSTCDNTWRGTVDSQDNSSIKFSRELLVNKDFMCSSVAYRLGLNGPCYSVNTACSTSLAALHLACQSILDNESEMVVVGGASVTFPSKNGYFYEEGVVNSPDGHCCPFDKDARGTVPGNGVGAVVLKKVNRAMKDKDAIYAVIKGTVVNNDGNNKLSFAAPSFGGIESVIKEAYEKAAVDLDCIEYIEMHGTGTPMGDEVELAALKSVFQEQRVGGGRCKIGSVKANIGHLDAASGIAGFIKTVLILYHNQIPPAINFHTPNEELIFENELFSVNTDLIELDNQRLFCAGVNSLGQGGTNVHVVLENFLKQENEEAKGSGENQVLLFSAKTEQSLRNYINNFCNYIIDHKAISIADAAYTLAMTKNYYQYRTYLVVKEWCELKEANYKVKRVERRLQVEDIDVDYEKNKNPIYTPQEIGELWVAGNSIDLKSIFGYASNQKVHLPTYSFDKIEHQVMRSSNKEIGINQESRRVYYYKLDWKLDNLSCLLPKKSMYGFLIFTGSKYVEQVLEYFALLNDEVIIVQVGEEFKKINDNYFIIDSEDQAHYDYIFRYVRKLKISINYVINLVPLSAMINYEDLKSYHRLNTNLLMLRCITLGFSKYLSDRKITIGNITSNLYPLQKEDKTNFSFSELPGIQKVIEQEYPNITCINIDFNDINQRGQSIFTCILSELYKKCPVSTVVYDQEYRFVPEINILQEEDSEPRIFNNGVFIILGGSGRIGKLVADFISRNVNCTIIITGLHRIAVEDLLDVTKKGVSENVVKDLLDVLNTIAMRGSRVLISKVDILDKTNVHHFFERVSQQCGRVNGIINCIGVTDKRYNKIIEDASLEDIIHQLRIREEGLFVLDSVIDNYDYDFCVLFSSIASVMGGVGQFGYAGACSFMDRYIRTRNSIKQKKWEVINMDTWITATRFEDGFHLIPYDKTFAMLERIFQHKSVHEYMITFTDIQKYLTYSRLITESCQGEKTVELNVNEVILNIWNDIFGRDINPTENFFHIGGDSLKALEIISNVYNKLGIRLKIKDLFHCQTIEKLSDFINKRSYLPKNTITLYSDKQYEEYYPCSFAQREMFIEKNNIYSTRFNLTCVFIITGNLCLDRLNAALNEVIKRHEIYRTRFIEHNGVYCQKIENELKCEIKHVYANEIDAAIEQFIVGFDFSILPLLRMQLVTEKASDRQFLITDMHHAIFDDQSVQMFFEELLRIYVGVSIGNNIRQFKEYSYRQHQEYNQGGYLDYHKFWKEKQSEYQYTKLIPDQEEIADRYKRVRYCLVDEIQYDILTRIAFSKQMSLSSLVLSIWMLIVSHLSSQNNVSSGLRIVDRRLGDFKSTMGCFLEKMLLMTAINKESSLSKYIDLFAQEYHSLYENSRYPFYLLTQDYQRDEMFSILFNYMKVEDNILDNGEITLTPYKYEAKKLNSKYLFNFRFMDDNNKIVCSLKYKSSLYSDNYIEEMFALFQEIIGKMPNCMNSQINEILLHSAKLP